AIDYPGIENAAACDAQSIRGLAATPTSSCTFAGKTTTVKGFTAKASSFCMCGASTADCSSSCASGLKNYAQVITSGTYNTSLNYPGIPKSVPLSSTAVMQVAE